MTVAELRDYITRRKNKKSQQSKEVKMLVCTCSRIRIDKKVSHTALNPSAVLNSERLLSARLRYIDISNGQKFEL